MTTKNLFAVKFDKGYYAQRQPNYDWSFTDDIQKAKLYKKFDEADARGKWGLGLISQSKCENYIIEQWIEVSTLSKLDEIVRNKHTWEVVSPGDYDTLYECKKCKKRNMESIDDLLHTQNPEYGCGED